VSADAASAAFQRFVHALNHARDPAALGAAVTGEIRIDRYRPGDRGTTQIAEVFAGIDAVTGWFARTPPGVTFSVTGAPWPEPDGAWGVQYAIAAGEFHNRGIWIATLAADGRIAALSHHPFALRDESPR
jgi:hypothetical protein